MTISSNKDNKKFPKKDSKFKIWYKDIYRNHGPMSFIFPLIIIVSLIGGYYDETTKSAEYEMKVQLIKEKKPLLICHTSLFCGNDRFDNYNLMNIDGNYQIEALNESNTHVKYISLNRVDVVELIK